MSIEAYIACNRFGLGARGDDLTRIASDPRGWLISQLNTPTIPGAVKQDMGGKQALAARLENKQAKKDGMPQMPKDGGAAVRKVYIG